MLSEKVRLREAVKTAEKEMYRTNLLLENLYKLNESMKTITSSLKEAESVTEDSPIMIEYFNELTNNKNLLKVFKELDNNLKRFNFILKDFESKVTQNALFLENFRNYRTYMFPSKNKEIEFIKQIAETLSISEFCFKPEMIGTMNIEEIAKDLKLIKENSCLIVQDEQIRRLLEFIERNERNKTFKLETDQIKITCKANQITIETTNPQIKRIDQIAKSLDGSYE
ncbi:MAG: hypothetical protein ABH821_01960 [archaeon]